MAEITPEMLEQFKACREAVKANPDIVEASIAKLSPAAQEPAKKLRDLVVSDEEDLDKFTAASEAIKAGLSEEVANELEEHNIQVAKAIGIMPSA